MFGWLFSDKIDLINLGFAKNMWRGARRAITVAPKVQLCKAARSNVSWEGENEVENLRIVSWFFGLYEPCHYQLFCTRILDISTQIVNWCASTTAPYLRSFHGIHYSSKDGPEISESIRISKLARYYQYSLKTQKFEILIDGADKK